MKSEHETQPSDNKPRIIERPGYDPESGIWFFNDCAILPDADLFQKGKASIITLNAKKRFETPNGEEFIRGYDFRNPTDGAPSLFPGQKSTHITAAIARIKEDPMKEGAEVATIFFQLAADLIDTFGGPDGLLALGNLITYAVAPELLERHHGHPGLWITGKAGTGKSCTAFNLMKIWGINGNYTTQFFHNLTRIGVERNLYQNSNLPVHFDEFRRSTSDSTLEQALYPAFSRTETIRGNLIGGTIKSKPTTSPLITGENATKDVALASRFLIVTLDLSKRPTDHVARMQTFYRMMEMSQEYHRIGRLLLMVRTRYASYFTEFLKILIAEKPMPNVADRRKLTHSIAYSGYMATVDFLMAAFSTSPEDQVEHIFPVDRETNEKLRIAHHSLYAHVEQRLAEQQGMSNGSGSPRPTARPSLSNPLSYPISMPSPETPLENPPLTAPQLARKIGRSGYGVKKAIHRLGIAPTLQLGGISYYDPAIEDKVVEAMRGPNLNPRKL